MPSTPATTSGSLAESNRADALTRVLYPADTSPAGQELRLRQEYFFSSASLQDILRRHLQQYPGFENLPETVAIQLNDTHPAVCVAELMRLLIDIHGMDFAKAWDITRGTIGYTNHTLLPEALESWPVPLFERLLPRHMQIIYEINGHLLREARVEHGFDNAALRNISLIDENGERRVRMGNLAFVGAHTINGVSALHSELLKATLFRDLHRMYPDRINNKTNGITPRRWLMECNPDLTGLLRETIGDRFLDDIDAIRALEAFAGKPDFQDAYASVKRRNKDRLATLVRDRMGVRIDPDAIFDIQVKRIHEYKRQLLNIIETVALYDQIRSHPERNWVPRVKIFAGKAAPSYHKAKLIIKLANDVARVINADPTVRDLLKVVFIPNYNVSLAEVMVPAADLSEQISTAGMEASGTGNMKFALNGAHYHRHAGRRERRDPRAGGRGQHRHLRPDRRGGRCAPRRRAHRALGDRALARARPGARRHFLRRFLARRSGALPRADRGALRSGLVHGCHRFRRLCRSAARGGRDLVRTLAVVEDGDPEHGAHVVVLVGPHDPAVFTRHLERPPVAFGQAAGGGNRAVTSKPSARKSDAAGRLPASEIDAVVRGRHRDPFAVLGVQGEGARLIARAFVEGAEELEAFTLAGKPAGTLERRHDAGFFEGRLTIRKRQPLRYRARRGGAEWWVTDPYGFGPVLGPMDDYYIGERSHLRLYDKLGAHPMHHEGADGVHFAVWAPNAARVSVVGDFNAWDGRRHAMRLRIDTGIWEIFVPDVGPGVAYKYEILAADGTPMPLKADPFAFASELRPATASRWRRRCATTGATRRTATSGPRPTRGGSRSRSTRCTRGHGGAMRTAGSSAGTRWPTG